VRRQNWPDIDCAGVIEIAETVTLQPRRRPVLFCLWTAQEPSSPWRARKVSPARRTSLADRLRQCGASVMFDPEHARANSEQTGTPRWTRTGRPSVPACNEPSKDACFRVSIATATAPEATAVDSIPME